MNNNQATPPVYVNMGFQHNEGRPPPYTPQQGLYPSLPQEPPSYVAVAPPTINTHYTVAAGTPYITGQKRGIRKCHWRYILCSVLCAACVLAVVGVLLWYFLYYQCLMGKSCKSGGKCLSRSQWCDGVRDCSRGEDESHCFRLYGTNFTLQMYSSNNDRWMPVCAENWNNDYGKATCAQIGYSRQDYVSYSQSADSLNTNGYMKLNPGSSSGSSLQSRFTYSQTCSTKAVKLQCVDCGQSSSAPNTRIVGGTAAVNGAWPWQVSLQYNGFHVCGGSIITSSWIVSAAHCFQTYKNPQGWLVYSGDVSMYQLKMSVGKTVKKIIWHQQYKSLTNDYDIALLQLDTPLTFTRTVRPVCLPNIGVNLLPERQAWITGWGALRSSGSSPDILNQAQVTIYSRDTCNRPEVLDEQVTQTMICAGKLQGGVDTCQGDSGGPLVVKEGDVWWLTGDTSWWRGCALKNKPGVYGNITFFTDWIYEQ
uniref:Transmembrane serine protease 2 n=1 Tax=Anabas testudineus TaxID=64144 RepID=A0A3Q1H8D4_ANATE